MPEGHITASANSRQRQRGVVNQDVDPAEAVERVRDDRFGTAGSGDIGGDSKRAFTNVARDLLGARCVTHVHRNGCAALVQASGRGATQAAGGTRDNRHAAGEILSGVIVRPGFPEVYVTAFGDMCRRDAATNRE